MTQTNTQKTNDDQRKEWQGVTLEDIDKQWEESHCVHPSFGHQLGHFAAGIDKTLKERNHE